MSTAADLLDRLTLEVLVPPADTSTFLLDESELNTRTLGAADEALEWLPVLNRATAVSTRRGASQDSATASIDVGTMNVAVLGEVAEALRIRPGTPIRLRDTTAGVTLFTGEVADLRTSHERDLSGGTATTRSRTTITAVDVVQRVANTMRYGAVVGDTDDDTPRTYETFEQRIDRLLGRTGLPYAVAPNEPVEVKHPPATVTLGARTFEAISGAPDLWTPSGPDVDLVIGTMHWGPGSELVGYTAGCRLLDGTHQPGQSYVSRPLHNLFPGATYTLTVHNLSGGTGPVALGVVGIGYDVRTAATGPATYTFVATDTTHHVFIGPGTTRTIPGDWPDVIPDLPWTPDMDPMTDPPPGLPFMSVSLTEWRMPRGQDWMLQNIVYESTLANHLDLATNTVRGYWWADRDGVIRAMREPGWADPVAIFTDATAGRPNALSYVDVASSFDTARIINDVRLSNHGRTLDETGNAVAHDVTITARDATSIATNGARAGEVAVSIYDPANTSSIYYGAGKALARSYVKAFSRSGETVSRVRLRTTPAADLVAGLDVYDAVTVERAGRSWDCRIAAIEHEITPNDWHTSLDLIERT